MARECQGRMGTSKATPYQTSKVGETLMESAIRHGSYFQGTEGQLPSLIKKALFWFIICNGKQLSM